VVLTFQKYSRVRDNGWLIRKNIERGVVMTKKEIKDDLLEQLEAQGKYQNYYLDLIEDYMKYYDLKRKCQRDIKEKGLRYEVVSGNGFKSEKPNESVQNLMKITTTMLKILDELGLQNPINTSDNSDDDYY
jgi:phage terminase small subunit